MISVIVPVYNVEAYLAQCLDSILAQTYHDLEILLIDDGSADRSGSICDAYQAKDERITVFHTTNHGLSAARNVGLDHAHGEYIAFVDSDDWIEHNMLETLYQKTAESGADVVECGYLREYRNGYVRYEMQFRGENALNGLLSGKISNIVWNKLWKAICFTNIRFPEGMMFEDTATTYRAFLYASAISIPDCLYHYRFRQSSISQKHTTKSLTDFWIAHRDRYAFCKNVTDNEGLSGLRSACATSIIRMWRWYLAIVEDRDGVIPYVLEMQAFVRENYDLFGDKKWKIGLRVGIFLARYRSWLSFLIAYCCGQGYRIVKYLRISKQMERRKNDT